MLVVLFPALGAGAKLDQDGQLATFEFLGVFNKEFTWLKRLSVSDWVINYVFRRTSTQKININYVFKENKYTKNFSSFLAQH